MTSDHLPTQTLAGDEGDVARRDLMLTYNDLGFSSGEMRSDAAASGLQMAAVGQVLQKARETFGTDEKARQWLLRPTRALSNSSPLDVSFAAESGVRKVVDLLGRIDHGLSV